MIERVRSDSENLISALEPVKFRARARVHLEWHESWTPSVAQAFAAMPYDPLMDPELVRRLWELGVGRERQKIAILRAAQGEVVGVVPLRKRGKLSWQFLTHYVMPYCRFFVLPDYTASALRALRAEIDCNYVLFYELPAHRRMLRPEVTWVVSLPRSYTELMQQTRYSKKDRQCRKRSAGLTLREDCFEALPEALELWQAKWLAAGSPATAGRKDELLLSYSFMAEQGSLKTFSLHDGETLAAMEMSFRVEDTLYAMTTIAQDAYRPQLAGLRCNLATMEWACGAGIAEYDMMPTGSYKDQWAEARTKSYRLVRSPLGIEALGCATEDAKKLLWALKEHRR